MPQRRGGAQAVQNARHYRHRPNHDRRHGMDPRVKPEDDEGLNGDGQS